MVTVDELLQLSKEALQGKYLEVVGKAPLTALTKQQLADEIVKASTPLSESKTPEELEAEAEHIKQVKEQQAAADKAAADKAAADKAAADKAAADKAAADKAAADKAAADKAAADKAAADKAAELLASEEAAKPASKKTIHLAKREAGKVVDELQVTPEIWQNMPKGEKSKWAIKQPDELKK